MEHLGAHPDPPGRRINDAVDMKLAAFQSRHQRQGFDGGARFVGIGQRTVARATEVQRVTAVGVEHGIVADSQHLTCPRIERDRRTRGSARFFHGALKLAVLGILQT